MTITDNGVLNAAEFGYERCGTMAEEVGFEPTGLAPSGFQDQRIRPLCHPSACHECRGYAVSCRASSTSLMSSLSHPWSIMSTRALVNLCRHTLTATLAGKGVRLWPRRTLATRHLEPPCSNGRRKCPGAVGNGHPDAE